MSRIEKKSRIHGIPTKLKKNIIDNSFFPICKEIRDIPNIQNITFDESKIINYHRESYINLPYGLTSGSIYRTTDKTGSFFITGHLNKNTIENLLLKENYISSSFNPFCESGNPVIELLNITSSFYLTGTSIDIVGQGFSEPLSSKSKIEIDIMPTGSITIGLNNHDGNNNNYPMAYWSPQEKNYSRIGTGEQYENDTTIGSNSDLEKFMRKHTIGFGSSYTDETIAQNIAGASIIGEPISSYGFPYESKFEASSSCLIDMSKYITEPFLAEKIAIYVNLQFNSGNIILKAPKHYIVNFFLLNQKKGFYEPKGFSEPSYYEDAVELLPSSYNTQSSQMTNVRELVTWAQISVVPDSSSLNENQLKGLKRDLTVYGTTLLNGQYLISANFKNPIKNDGVFLMTPADNGVNVGHCFKESWRLNGNSLYDSGRNWLTNFDSSKIVGTTTIEVGACTKPSSTTVNINEKYYKINPYLIIPKDKLIFGFQVPMPMKYMNYKNSVELYNGSGPNVTINSTGINKIIIYGSYLRNNKSYQEIVLDANNTHFHNEFNEV